MASSRRIRRSVEPDLAICKAVTIPRIRAAFTGLRSDGKLVEGQYFDGSELSDGFDENAIFFDLAYEDPDSIEVGEQFLAILPALWLASGAIGNFSKLVVDKKWFISPSVPFAVLLDEDYFKDFNKLILARPDLTHVWLVTDSEPAFSRMRERLSSKLHLGMLYRDYLRNFRINMEVK